MALSRPDPAPEYGHKSLIVREFLFGLGSSSEIPRLRGGVCSLVRTCLRPISLLYRELTGKIHGFGRFLRESSRLVQQDQRLACKFPKIITGKSFRLTGNLVGGTGKFFAIRSLLENFKSTARFWSLPLSEGQISPLSDISLPDRDSAIFSIG